jgi:transposase, IS30 family
MDFEIRRDRSPQGPRKLLKEREHYLALVQQGMSNRQACQRVGVNEPDASGYAAGPRGCGLNQPTTGCNRQ